MSPLCELFAGEKKQQIELRKVSEVSTNGFGSGSSSSMSLSSGNGVLEENEEHSAEQLRLDHFSFSPTAIAFCLECKLSNSCPQMSGLIMHEVIYTDFPVSSMPKFSLSLSH